MGGEGGLINFPPPEKGEGSLIITGRGLIWDAGDLEDLQYSHKKMMWSKQS